LHRLNLLRLLCDKALKGRNLGGGNSLGLRR